MAEFTKEQESEIQKRIDEARKKEQHRMSADQAYKESIVHLRGMIDQFDPNTGQLLKRGIYDPYVLQAFTEEYRKFLLREFPQKPPAQPEEPAEGDDE